MNQYYYNCIVQSIFVLRVESFKQPLGHIFRKIDSPTETLKNIRSSSIGKTGKTITQF